MTRWRNILLIGVLVVVIAVTTFFINTDDTTAPTSEIVQQDATTQNTTSEVVEPEQPPLFDAASLQSALGGWVDVLPANASASVVIASADGTVIASTNPDQSYFAASIYKLFVAYAGYQQVDDGVVNPDEQYLAGQTRAECLDVMIRESDSPCAETLWDELGKQALTDQLVMYGIENTNMVALSTTAADTNRMLARIARSEGLSNSSQTAFLDSMKDQPALFRRGLPSGFSNAVAYNKVGWNLTKEWHDTAIVEVDDGRQFLVSVLTENVGIARVSDLGGIIEEQIKK